MCLMFTKRPLLDTAADQRLYVCDASRNAAVAAALRHANTLIVGEAGSGKTSLLYRVRAASAQSSAPRPVLFIDARLATDPRELIDLILREAESQELVEAAPRPPADDPFGPVTQLRRLQPAASSTLVLVDDPTPSQARILFGRFRDELFQLPTFFAVSASPQTHKALNQPPSDVFFDAVVQLKPLDPDPAFELLRLRKELGQIPDQILWPSRPMQPRAILLDAQAGPTAARHDAALEAQLQDLATASVGRAGAALLREIWGRGAISASDSDLQRQLGVTRARLTQLLRELEKAGILVTFAETREGGLGRPRTMYDVNTQRPVRDDRTQEQIRASKQDESGL